MISCFTQLTEERCQIAIRSYVSDAYVAKSDERLVSATRVYFIYVEIGEIPNVTPVARVRFRTAKRKLYTDGGAYATLRAFVLHTSINLRINRHETLTVVRNDVLYACFEYSSNSARKLRNNGVNNKYSYANMIAIGLLKTRNTSISFLKEQRYSIKIVPEVFT